jgi:hypothetical protein
MRRTLGDLDIGIDRAVVVVQREAGRLVLLRIADRDDRRGQPDEVARRIGRPRLGLDELRAASDEQERRQRRRQPPGSANPARHRAVGRTPRATLIASRTRHATATAAGSPPGNRPRRDGAQPPSR